VGHVTRMGEMRNAYRIFVGKPEGGRSSGKPRRGWKDNIRMYLKEIEREVVDGHIWLRIGKSGRLF